MANHPNRSRLTRRELEALIHAADLASEEPATWEIYEDIGGDREQMWRACGTGLDKLRRMLAGRR